MSNSTGRELNNTFIEYNELPATGDWCCGCKQVEVLGATGLGMDVGTFGIIDSNNNVEDTNINITHRRGLYSTRPSTWYLIWMFDILCDDTPYMKKMTTRRGIILMIIGLVPTSSPHRDQEFI